MTVPASSGVAFSVAIPTYNRASYLEQAIEAVLGQTYPPAEVVVVDDGSQDHTPSVLAKYAGRVRWQRVSHRGSEAARKVAVELGTAEWIALCDSDDLWQPDHLARRKQLIEAKPDVEFAFSNFSEFGTRASTEDKYDTMPPGWWSSFQDPDKDGFRSMGKNSLPALLRATPIFPSTVTIRRSLYARVGGIRGEFSHLVTADSDLIRRCVAVCEVACDERVTVRIRKDGQNKSRDLLRARIDSLHLLSLTARDDAVPPVYRADLEEAIRRKRLGLLRYSFALREYETFVNTYQSTPPQQRTVGLTARYLAARLSDTVRRSFVAPVLASGRYVRRQ